MITSAIAIIILLTANRVEITSLAASYRLPAIYAARQLAQVGGLLSYGSDIRDNYRRAASYVDRILKGEKPSELPVQLLRCVDRY